MKTLSSIVLVVAGVALDLLGLLFLVGSAGRPSRLLVGAVGMGLGALLVGLGVRLWQQAQAATPARIAVDILALARRRNGEVSDAEIAAALGDRAPLAPAVLDDLVARRVCERSRRDGTSYFLFKALQARLVVRRCEFCKMEVSLAEGSSECPRCGGKVEKRAEAVSVEGAYRMDE